MANTPLADFIRRRPAITMAEAAKLLGLSERSVDRLVEAGQLAEPGRFGRLRQFSTADVTLAHLRRVLRTADEAIADDMGADDDDPGLFDRAEATG